MSGGVVGRGGGAYCYYCYCYCYYCYCYYYYYYYYCKASGSGFRVRDPLKAQKPWPTTAQALGLKGVGFEEMIKPYMRGLG